MLSGSSGSDVPDVKGGVDPGFLLRFWCPPLPRPLVPPPNLVGPGSLYPVSSQTKIISISTAWSLLSFHSKRKPTCDVNDDKMHQKF